MSRSAERLSRLRETLGPLGVDALIITKPENIFYLSGFTGTTADLVVSRDRCVLVTDFRYTERAQEEVGEAEIRAGADIMAALEEVLKELSPQRVGVETHVMTADLYAKVSERLKPIEVRSAGRAVETLREIKDADELVLMGESAKMASAAFSHILPHVKSGVVEEEVALEILTFLYGHGAEKMSFEVIVASGARSAMPHARPSQKRIARGDLVTIDLGVVYRGYYSDMTRTFVVGRASDEQRKLYGLVRQGQAQALEAVAPGKTGQEIDGMCRAFFAEKGRGEYFLHGLGHGVGLEVHEAPVLGKKGREPLKVGMVFTVEPGLYVSGLGGVRIEDMVVLKETGPEIMTKYGRELIEL